jgi:predicted nucleic acid-binding protein
VLALRTLGEVYVTLTRLPVRPRISSQDAMALVTQIGERLTLISLDGQEYLVALRLLAERSVVGAAAYDGLIAHCAHKAGVEVILTWNTRDFARFDPGIARVLTPMEL